MRSDLIDWWGVLVPIVFGGGLGIAIGRYKHKWKIGLGLTVAPPVLWCVLYLLASGTGCAGGSCMGPMIGLLLVGGIAALVTLVGLGILIQAVLSAMAQ